MRILHLPDVVGGHATELARAERRQGLDSRSLNFYRSPYGFRADIELGLEGKGRIQKAFAHLQALAEFRRGFDVYHFNYGSSFLHFAKFGISHLDLPFVDPDAAKIFTYQGCDARQKYPTMHRNEALGSDSAACFEADCYDGVCNSGQLDKWRRRSIEKADRHAFHIFALNPDLLYFLPAEKSSF
ncbi:MAG TPA: hypothetical protein DCW74_17770, partial [Alteromonas australica]|nr:hypothetical protein [Alteromonas australica]